MSNARCVTQLPDSGYVLCGNADSGAVVVRLNSAGNIIWIKEVYELGSYPVAHSILYDGGELYCAGTLTGMTLSDNEIFAFKMDTLGNLIWLQTYGGAFQDDGNSIAWTSDGNLIITGASTSFSVGSGDACILKINSLNGNLIWSRTIGSASYDGGYNSRVLADDKIIMVGSTDVDGILAVLLDSSGNMIWSRSIKIISDTIFGTTTWGVISTVNGDFIICGVLIPPASPFQPYMMKLDSLGNIIWTRIYYSDAYVGEFFSLENTRDSGIILTYEPEHIDSLHTGSRFGLLKTDSDGNVEWSMLYDWEERNFPNCAIQTSDGGFIAVGYRMTTWEIFIVKTDSLGFTTPSCADHAITVTVQDSSAYSMVFGSLQSTFQPTVSSVYTINANVTDAFLCWGVADVPVSEVQTVQLYPNPTTGNFNISGGFPDGSVIRIYDAFGKEVIVSIPISSGSSSTYVHLDLVPGMYFYVVQSHDVLSMSGRLIIIE